MKSTLEVMPTKVTEFDLLGVWQTKDGRLAVATELDSFGMLSGYVTRAGRTYRCSWDSDMFSVAPFRYVDDLAIKME